MIRRDLLKMGGAATLGLAAASPFAAAAGRSNGRAGTILFDARFPHACAFAAAARTSGAQALETGQDLLSLWHGTLRGQSLAGLAGMTSYAEMVVIAGLVADERRSFAMRLAHVAGNSGIAHETVDGPAGAARVLNQAGGNWPVALWSILGRNAAAGAIAGPGRATLSHRPGTLWSWAVA
jgi:hypothetical protein